MLLDVLLDAGQMWRLRKQYKNIERQEVWRAEISSAAHSYSSKSKSPLFLWYSVALSNQKEMQTEYSEMFSCKWYTFIQTLSFSTSAV